MRALALAISLAIEGSASPARPEPSGPQSSFMIFFDWAKPDVRSDDQAVLDQVVDAYRARPGARLMLSGHTDRSGSAAVNRAAGLRRAHAVRAQLEKRGIPRSAMRIVSFGEGQPLVPTEDGVREVQNRRVEIAFKE